MKRFYNTPLLLPLKNWVKNRDVHNKVKLGLIGLCSQTRFTSGLYYLLVNDSFKREQQSVLKGRLSYHRGLQEVTDTSALLRRNIHRLEKGLIMRPRKALFATAFIGETVDIYSLLLKKGGMESEEAKWAGDVLSEYFSVITPDESVARVQKVFSAIKVKSSRCFTPYSQKEIVKAGIGYQELQQLFKQRRSVRWYIDKPVESEHVEKAVDIAALAPSACNRQPFELHMISSREMIDSVADCAMGTKGFSHNIPMLIVVVGDLSAYPLERDRHLIYIDASLMSMQFMLALETLGLSSCPINWPDIESRERRLDAILNLEMHQRTVMLIAVGYADPEGGIAYSQKKDSVGLIKRVD